MKKKIRSMLRLCTIPVAWCVLTPVIFVFLTRNRKLFEAPLVMPFYTHSFGHSLLALDFAARLYAQYKISVVMVRDPKQNAYVPSLFRENMTIHMVNTMRFSPYTVGAVLRTLMYFLCPLVGHASLIELGSVYRAISRLSGRVAGSEEEDRLITHPIDISGWVYMLDHDIGPRPSLPPDLVARCRSFIEAKHPDFFFRPFVTLLLRAKGQNEPELSARSRSSGPVENYRPAVAHAIARGFHVVGTGETINSAFADIPGFFDLGEVPDSPGLINLFLLSHCALFVGQISGPFVLPTSSGIPCLITDALPHRVSALCERNITLYKSLRLEGREAPLNLVEIYTQHQDLAYGYGFGRKKATIDCNSPEELRKAMEEALDRLASPPPPDVAVLASQLRELMDPLMPAYHYASRPPEFVLRSLPLDGNDVEGKT